MMIVIPSNESSLPMLFASLRPSNVLNIVHYSDVDQFHVSERYASAESVPLAVRDFRVSRASLALPSCTLSLVRTFPRIITGYDFSGRLLIIVPMDGISSARLNGSSVGQSLIVIKGRTNCTVVEPEGRLVAIISMQPELLDRNWLDADDGHVLLRLELEWLANLQRVILNILRLAAMDPQAIAMADVRADVQGMLLLALADALRSGTFHDHSDTLARYKAIIDRVDLLLDCNPLNPANEWLADETGVSTRTLQTASQTVCGLGIHRYGRLRRLWSVRRQLRHGAPGLTVKASALAHGFRHISQFTKAYHESFGELPSATLARARSLEGLHAISFGVST